MCGGNVVYFVGWVFLGTIVVVGVGIVGWSDAYVLAEAMCRWIIEFVGDVVGVDERWAKG